MRASSKSGIPSARGTLDANRFSPRANEPNTNSGWVQRGAWTVPWRHMSVYEDRKQALEEYEFRMGLERGRLAVTLDLLTDALVLVGQHGVYCQSARQPGKPAMDVQMISQCLTDAKELVTTVMSEIQRKKSQAL